MPDDVRADCGYRCGDSGGVLAEIGAERRSQIGKGYDAAHDDAHSNGEIVTDQSWGVQTRLRGTMPADRRSLVEAAAMLVAEIERIDRAARR